MEIGSIFELNINELFKENKNDFYLPFMKNGEYGHTKLFNTGRTAIEYLLRSLKKKNNYKGTILVPSYICSSVTDAIERAGYIYMYYKIKSNLKIDVKDLESKITEDIEYVFIVHYFGTYSDKETVETLNRIKDKDIKIIEDISHSLYTYDKYGIGYGDYVIGSIRKWISIPDGGFLSAKETLPEIQLEEGTNTYSQNYLAAQIMKFKYLNNKNLDKEKFLDLNSIAMDSLFSDYKLREISKISKNYIKSYDMKPVINKRIENYDYLYKNIKGLIRDLNPLIKRKPGEVPFGFPIVSNQRDELLDYLIKQDIYCNIHWEIDEQKSKNNSEIKEISNKIMTVPCDQRYGKKEMNYIIEVIKRFYADRKG